MQGIADLILNHENKKYSSISETVQAMPIMLSVKIVRLNMFF